MVVVATSGVSPACSRLPRRSQICSSTVPADRCHDWLTRWPHSPDTRECGQHLSRVVPCSPGTAHAHFCARTAPTQGFQPSPRKMSQLLTQLAGTSPVRAAREFRTKSLILRAEGGAPPPEQARLLHRLSVAADISYRCHFSPNRTSAPPLIVLCRIGRPASRPPRAPPGLASPPPPGFDAHRHSSQYTERS